LKFRILVALALAFAFARPAVAQGVQTGQLVGTVRSGDGQALPGATVTVKSPGLQGSREQITDASGDYSFKNLPTGTYTVTVSLSGMSSVEQKQVVALGSIARVDASLSVKNIEETIVVTAETSSVLTTSHVGANYEGDTVRTLPTSRTLAGIAELAPGLTNDTPNADQVSIAGGFAYDNVFLIDGVDVNDNLFGSPNNLFIEDAIEETQVLTSGISAEYGRFSGGVVNAVTKRGGNDFSGSYRAQLNNPKWTSKNPFEKANNVQRTDDTNVTHEVTFGGPLVKDRLWFFVAGRKAATTTSNVFPDTGISTDVGQDNKRGQIKLTGTINPNHTLSATYLNNATEQTQPSFGFATAGIRSIDPHTIATRSLPNSLFVTTYTGILRPDVILEAQYSEKKFEFKDSGGTGQTSDIVASSPFLTLGATTNAFGHYNAPYFDSTDPEQRNNRQIAASLSYYLSTGNLGRHDLKVGYENYRSTDTGGNSQSPTNYVFYADYAQDASGQPLLDSSGFIVPDFVSGQSQRTLYLALRNARIDTTTQSFFLNDHWQIDSHWSANLGVRYERVRAQATGNIVGIDTDTIVPRFAVSFDPKGDGRYRIDATYAQYAGKYNEAQTAGNTNVGTPNYLYQLYVGPSCQGRNCAAAYDNNNYVNIGGVFPTANVFFDKNLSSPITTEYSVTAKAAVGQRGGYVALSYTKRDLSNFIEDFFGIDEGTTTVIQDGVDYGTFDNRVVRNSDEPTRRYQGLSFQTAYRPTTNWGLYGNYTLQLKNEGNFEGELRNQPAQSSLFGNYPELFVPDRNFPIGRNASFQRHKVRAWTTYDFNLGRVGTLASALIWRYDSALTYSLTNAAVPFSAIQLSRDPGYAGPPSTQPLFFGGKGTQDFAGSHKFDVALTYSIPVVKNVSPYVKFTMVNVLNNDKLTTWNTAVSPNNNGPRDANGLPTQFIQGSRFGTATSATNFPLSYLSSGTAVRARAFDLALGFRF
jgi:Carboxypeptidase regulatory-like domain